MTNSYYNHNSKDKKTDENEGLRLVLMCLFAMLLFIAVFYTTINVTSEKDGSKLAERMESEQLAEGELRTATVESIDVTNGFLIMSNGHKISTDDMSAQPGIGDTLEYVETFDFHYTPLGLKKTDDQAFINIEVKESHEK